MRLLIWILCFGYNPLKAQTNSMSKQMDSLIQDAVSLGLFSGNVLVMQQGHILYEKSVGEADQEHHKPNTPSTCFQLASITKDFTKTLILQFVRQHRLSLNDPVGNYLDGFSPEVQAVTIGQLLSFRSGLGDYHMTADFQMIATNRLLVKDLLPIIRKEKLRFKPGTRFLYSNSGYVLLAAVIEQVSGLSFEQALQKYIWAPCQMKHTGINGYSSAPDSMAVGYLSNVPGVLKNNSDWPLCGAGDGGIYTTTHDLYAFIYALFETDHLLSDEEKCLFVSEKEPLAAKVPWDTLKRTVRYAPAGGAPGVSTYYQINPDNDLVILVLSNYDQGHAETIGAHIYALLTHQDIAPLQQPPSIYIFQLIREKGGAYFEKNYPQVIKNSGMMPDDDMVLFQVGSGLRDADDIPDAISLYKVYTTLFPGIMVGWNELGECYASQHQVAEARHCFEQAARLQPDNPRLRNNLLQVK